MKRFIKFSLVTMLVALPATSLVACNNNKENDMIVNRMTFDEMKGALTVKVKSLEDIIKDLNDKVKEFKEFFEKTEKLKSQKEAYEAEIEKQYDAIKAVTDQLTKATDIKITDIKNMTASSLKITEEAFVKLSDTDKRLKALEEYRNNIKTRVTELEGKVDALTAKNNELEEEIATGKRKLEEADEKLQEVIEKFKNLFK